MEWIADNVEWIADNVEWIADNMEWIADNVEWIVDNLEWIADNVDWQGIKIMYMWRTSQAISYLRPLIIITKWQSENQPING